jgi:hypothetical protein
MSFAQLKPNHNKILEAIEAGGIDTKALAESLLGWMTDEDIHAWALANDYGFIVCEDSEESEEEDA